MTVSREENYDAGEDDADDTVHDGVGGGDNEDKMDDGSGGDDYMEPGVKI